MDDDKIAESAQMRVSSSEVSPNIYLSGLAKWLIPSLAGVFAITGYIVQIAHEDALGVGSLTRNNAVYAEAAATFVRDLISLPIDLIGNNRSLSPGSQSPVLLVTLVLVALPIASKRLRASPEWLKTYAWPITISLLLLIKFAHFDAPLTLVHDLLSGNGVAARLIDPESSTEDPSGSKGKFFAYQASRANQLAFGTFCAHVGTGQRANSPEFVERARAAGSSACNPQTNGQSADQPRMVFLMMLLMQVVITWGAISIIYSQGASNRLQLIAGLALIYSLTIPYAYGKMIRSTSFDVGVIFFADQLTGDDGVDTEGFENGQTKRFTALIIGDDGAQTRVLTAIPSVECLPSTKRRNEIKILSIATSKIISFNKTDTRDVFEWGLAAKSCN